MREQERVNDTGVCRMTITGNVHREISGMVKSFLFRVIQEFIQNSLKHSGCGMIAVEITDQPGGLSVIILDDGKGFDAGDIHSNGIGLNNMKRRILLVGGLFDLTSEPGKGTCLHIFIANKNLLT